MMVQSVVDDDCLPVSQEKQIIKKAVREVIHEFVHENTITQHARTSKNIFNTQHKLECNECGC
jgi:hypothetical protein